MSETPKPPTQIPSRSKIEEKSTVRQDVPILGTIYSSSSRSSAIYDNLHQCIGAAESALHNNEKLIWQEGGSADRASCTDPETGEGINIERVIDRSGCKFFSSSLDESCAKESFLGTPIKGFTSCPSTYEIGEQSAVGPVVGTIIIPEKYRAPASRSVTIYKNMSLCIKGAETEMRDDDDVSASCTNPETGKGVLIERGPDFDSISRSEKNETCKAYFRVTPFDGFNP